MRHQVRFPTKGRPLACAAIASAVTMIASGCAAPGMSNKSFPALSWAGDDKRISTGSIPRQNVAKPQRLASPSLPTNHPRIQRTPEHLQTRSDQSPPNAPPHASNQTARGNNTVTQPQPREPAIAHNDTATFDPLPKYARADKHRNAYRWNGSHNRVSVDNRTPETKLATKSKVFVDVQGRRTVRVAPGDTLFGIAHRNGISTQHLMALNKMNRTELRAGQVISLPSNAH